MNIRNAVLAAAAAVLIAPTAFAATTATKNDCASAQKRADAALAANPHASTKARDARAEAEKLCQSGKTAEGIKKFDHAAKEATEKSK